ncbi:MAG: DDE-type integrase/transposase/recombinase [Bacteroidetes bacterium]|nr:DDE-type integrase/transposase/recombinase [Bacteroidota bacterium]MBS1932055.1 DDE-type integrase/transposase/recombinase [Bacteroidota bacterium]
MNRCLPKHPAQLMSSEVNAIKKYGEDLRFLHWPLSSVYHRIIRDGAAHFHASTFYKYARLLQLKRITPNNRRKNHCRGIRADAPLALLHADVTVFRTADNVKAYIYLLQDNFSRAILNFSVSLHCKAEIVFDLLKKAHADYLQPANIFSCQLMTDDGSENFGVVQVFLTAAENPTLQHIIAQRDVEFSNSMIEAANKNLKYRFLYHKNIADYNELCKYVQQAVDDYNNRPHGVLNWLTPFEVLQGKVIDKDLLRREMQCAQAQRIIENKKEKCCLFSF